MPLIEWILRKGVFYMNVICLQNEARALGFEAAWVNVSQILINPQFRVYCEENRCGQYGANYACPPDCGSPEEMAQRVLSFNSCLVVKSQWDIESYQDREAILTAKRRHNEAMLSLCDKLRREGTSCLMCGASQCLLCDTCARTRMEPCRDPARRYSCLSAYCIDVARLAEAAGMDFSWSDKKLSLYGLIAF